MSVVARSHQQAPAGAQEESHDALRRAPAAPPYPGQAQQHCCEEPAHAGLQRDGM